MTEIKYNGQIYRVIRVWLLNDEVKITALYKYQNTWREVKNMTTIDNLTEQYKTMDLKYIEYLQGKLPEHLIKAGIEKVKIKEVKNEKTMHNL